MKKLSAAVLLVLVVLCGCSKPTETVIPGDITTWDKELAPSAQKLSDEDRKLLAGYLARAKIGEAFGGKGVPVGTTIAAGIEDQKRWIAERERKEAEAAALKEKLQAERTQKIAELDKAVLVTLLSKREVLKDYQVNRYSDYQEFKVGIKNTSTKPVAGVAGSLEFVDIFDKTVGGVTFRITETIQPGSDVVWTGGRDYNQFIEQHKAVWNLESGKYKTRFVPETVIFSDGSKLTTGE
ncbi:hypothetical protein [Variovorax boronicumulans]|uniref:hypothetical protein n=1 Tax=Variovorax boronicumulans TaxID=436515 RepID=UPI0027834427|nr:hypothetical protein [Variovorax boronicumulans]MDQ0040848.1 hypothetical protein [Variovorax boronicumulans]